MANALYSLGKQKILEGNISWLSDDIKCVLIDVDLYSVDLIADEFLSDIPALSIVATSPNFASKTSTLGVADAADISFSSVIGAISEALVIYKDTGVLATSGLIVYIDTATGLPTIPDGNNINVLWDSGANKIFSL